MSKILKELQTQLDENINVHHSLLSMSQNIADVIKQVQKKINKGGKILFCGNGGSAADAQHLAAEFIVRLRPHINRNPIPALTLAQDTSTLTACGNDYSFEDIFLRPFQALVKKDDILICISTSGNSKNILRVLKEAKRLKIFSVCFLGKGGGKAKKLASKSIVVPSNNTARIQECHIFLGHFILEKIEDFIIKRN
jgi:D-sedoheptulose 7-phosphate isomerase